MQVKIRYGTGNEVSKDFPAGTTLGCILNNSTIRAVLGYGRNVQGIIGGVPQSDSLVPPDGAEISVTEKSCSKA